MPNSRATPPAGWPIATLAVVAAGIAAALHLGKLPPALPALQATLGIGLVEAGFLLSLVQMAGMTLGLAAGLAADTLGLRRSMLIGLLILTIASLLGGAIGTIDASAPMAMHAVRGLLILRALEGVGFLLVVMPAPALIRATVAAGSEKSALGLWGAYMPFGVALALLIGPALIAAWGWAAWWGALAVVSAAAAVGVLASVPPDSSRRMAAGAGPVERWPVRLRTTLSAGGPWRLAAVFAMYSAQWMAVIGFLPAIYAEAGVPAGWSAVLTALAAATNIGGNVLGGRLLQRGTAPGRLLGWGFAAMAVGGFAAFAQLGQGVFATGLPPVLRYVAVCVFSFGGGVVPATLFVLAVRVAPGPSTVATTVGLMQQASALGQFVAPPVVAWLAHRAGGWQWTWVVTLACALVGGWFARRLVPGRTASGAHA